MLVFEKLAFPIALAFRNRSSQSSRRKSKLHQSSIRSSRKDREYCGDSSMSSPVRARLHRRDLVLIPLLVVLTLAALAGLGELAAREVFVESGAETCGRIGPAGVDAMRPNCTSYRKAAEGPPTSNIYNECGYRTPEPCGALPPGAVRVAVMGASTAHGFKVPYAETFAARLTRAHRDCSRPAEFQNMGVAGAGLLDIYRRLPEALAMRPDLILIVLTPYEMKTPLASEDLAGRRAPLAREERPRAPAAPEKSLISRLSDLAYASRMLVAAQHFLFQDRAAFSRLFLLHGEDTDYLRVPFRPGWQKRVQDFELLLGEMAEQAGAAGVPMMLALVPQRIQASLLDPAVRPSGVDPFEIGRQLASVAARHHVAFEDTLRAFATVPDPDSAFYAVDGHIDARGHELVARALADHLPDGEPALQGCAVNAAAGNGTRS